MDESHKNGYLAFLGDNPHYRRLWYGQMVSQLGDWFDSIALYTLTFKLTNSGLAVGGVMLCQLLPTTLVAPFAGVVVDRLSRKTVMIAADVVRALLVLSLLLVRSPDSVWLIFPVIFLKVATAAFFEPARNASIPNIVSRRDIVIANAVGATTWSVMLAVGGALGGFVTDLAGPYTALTIDSFSFLLSAGFISSIPIPSPRGRARPPGTGLRDLVDGVRFLLRHGHVALYASIKTGHALMGGSLLVLTVLAKDVFPLGRDAALSMGLLYAARGLGTGIGPILARRLGGDSVRFLRRVIGPALAASAIGYLALKWVGIFPVALLVLVLAHIGGSVAWVFSTALLQIATPDEYRGRVFSSEMALFSLVTAASVACTGALHDRGWSGPDLAFILGCIGILPAVFFWVKLSLPAPEHHVPAIETEDV